MVWTRQTSDTINNSAPRRVNIPQSSCSIKGFSIGHTRLNQISTWHRVQRRINPNPSRKGKIQIKEFFQSLCDFCVCFFSEYKLDCTSVEAGKNGGWIALLWDCPLHFFPSPQVAPSKDYELQSVYDSVFLLPLPMFPLFFSKARWQPGLYGHEKIKCVLNILIMWTEYRIYFI